MDNIGEVFKELHKVKNTNLNINNIKLGSSIKVWWLGKCGHEWEARIANRVNGSGCPYCSKQKILSGFNDFSTTHPELASEWHPTLNRERTPHLFTSGSKQKFWWLGKCGHEWEANIANRVHGRGCPVCDGKIILRGFNDLASKNPDLSKEWHPFKNGLLTAENVSPNTNKKAWWIGKCGHEWQSSINNRNKGSGCLICLNKKVLFKFNDMATLYPEISKEWHPLLNEEIKPYMVAPRSHNKFWWLGECGHEWQASADNRTAKDSGCPYCAVRGFSTKLPSIFYFISNKHIMSYKIGITNVHTDRLKSWVSQGWEVIHQIRDQEGYDIRRLETKTLKWIREDLKLKQELKKEDMGHLRGETETFGFHINESIIIDFINESWKNIKD